MNFYNQIKEKILIARMENNKKQIEILNKKKKSLKNRFHKLFASKCFTDYLIEEGVKTNKIILNKNIIPFIDEFDLHVNRYEVALEVLQELGFEDFKINKDSAGNNMSIELILYF